MNNPQQQGLFNFVPLVHHADFFTPSQSAASKRAAGEQERRILAFLEGSGGSYGASTIWKTTERGEPITSTRRALTNLAEAGLVVKCAETVKGMFGKSEHTWRIAK